MMNMPWNPMGNGQPWNPNYNPMAAPNYTSAGSNNTYNSTFGSNSNQPVQGLVRVLGYEGAQNYRMAPNSCMPLFDGEQDVLYIKSTDGNGIASICCYDITPHGQRNQMMQQPMQQMDQYPMAAYAGNEEMEKIQQDMYYMKQELHNAKQCIQELKTELGIEPEWKPTASSNGQQHKSSTRSSSKASNAGR